MLVIPLSLKVHACLCHGERDLPIPICLNTNNGDTVRWGCVCVSAETEDCVV